MVADRLPYTDFLPPDDEEVLGFTGQKALADGPLRLLEAGAGCVAVAHGSRGALVGDAVGATEASAYVVHVPRDGVLRVPHSSAKVLQS